MGLTVSEKKRVMKAVRFVEKIMVKLRETPEKEELEVLLDEVEAEDKE